MKSAPCLSISAALLLAAGCVPPGQQMNLAPGAGAIESREANAFRTSMRKLWSDHVVWTRQYIVAAASDHPSAEAAASRLMRNQEDIGNAIEPYYGTAAGDRVRGHDVPRFRW